jgi:hypothetical protein
MQLRLGDICLLSCDQACCPARCAEEKQYVDSERFLFERAYYDIPVTVGGFFGHTGSGFCPVWELEIEDGCRALLIGQTPAIGSRSQERKQQ